MQTAVELEKAVSCIPEFELMDVQGQTVFPVYGVSGGVCFEQIFYLLKGGRQLGIRLKPSKEPSYLLKAILFGVREFEANAKPFDDQRSDLGLGIKYEDL